MKLKIKRIDKSLPLPVYEKGSACFDFICRQSVTVNPGEIKLVPSNVVIKVPKGYTILIFPRSSTPIKKGIIQPHSVGVLDSFYCGENDEIVLMFMNLTDKTVEVKRGEHLAQGMLVKYEQVEWIEVDRMKEKGRGGYNADFERKNKKR